MLVGFALSIDSASPNLGAVELTMGPFAGGLDDFKGGALNGQNNGFSAGSHTVTAFVQDFAGFCTVNYNGHILVDVIP